MSQSIVANEAIAEGESLSGRSEFDDFSYTPVTPLAPVTCFLGLASALGLVSWQCMVLAISGLIVGMVAWFRIRSAGGQLGGRTLVLIGLGAAVLFLVSGVGVHAHAYATEVPEGFLRVHFPSEISKKEFIEKDGVRELHPDVVPFIGEPIFTKGWMYQSKQAEELTEFVLLKDNGKCCFGGQPKPFDMIVVKMAGDLKTKGYTGMIFVTGVLEANPHSPPGAPVYTLTATQCGRAKSAF